MTAPDERAFRSLLRWYPRRWRERNEQVVLGTMLDDAEARGQRTPEASLRRATIVQGLGARLDRRTASIAASLAVAFGVAAISFFFAGAVVAGLVLGSGAAPLLILIAVSALLRTRGVLSAPEALAALALAIPAVAFSTLAGLSWSVGFDEGDAGITPSWFSQAFIWLVVAAWVSSAAWGAIVIGGVLRTLAMPTAWARLGAAGFTVVAYPFMAVTLMSPAASALFALATVGAVILMTREKSATTDVLRAAPARARTLRPARASVLVCAAVSTVAGMVAIVFALTGSAWTGGVLDSTEAMRVGIVAGFVCALPSCAAIGLMRSHGHRPINAWGPPALIAVSLLIAATENVIGGGDGNRIVWALTIAALPLGGAVAWILAVGHWAPRIVQRTVAALCGAFVVILGVTIQMLPFALPIAALVLAIGEARRLTIHRARRAQPSRAAAASA